MLKAKQSEITPTNPDQSLLAFKPRQVLLIEQSSKTNTMKHCNSNSSSKSRALNPDQKALLLHSVLRYLEHNGFSRTLKRLLSEAQIENDKWKTCSLDLEDMCGKYLPIDSNQSGTANKFAESAKNSGAVLTNNLLANSNVELKEKKKTKKIFNSFCQTEQVSAQALMEATVDAVCELKTDESTKKQDKKKKKSKSISGSLDGNVEQVHLDSLPALNEEKCKKLKPSSRECKIDSEAEVKSKDKKKKIKVAAEDKSKDLASSTGNNETDSKTDSKAEGKPRDKKKKSMDPLDKNPIRSECEKESLKTLEHVLYEDKKSSKKRKRLENEGQPGDILASEELKRRKTGRLEGTNSHGKLTEANVIIGDNKHARKERKGENGHVGQNEFQYTSSKQLEVQANGDLTKNGEKSAARKTGTKQYNGSVEPKTANAFQRVKLDEVEYADEKLQDNSYWAKNGAEVGYGAKAQEVLGQVRGRDFRHEKTKKKRGSYRGGQIDLQSHSVKFNYSDDD